MNDISSPSTGLEEIEADSPAAIRRGVANVIRRAVGADAAVFTRYSISEEGDYFTSTEMIADEPLVERFERHREGAKEGCSLWDPRYPPEKAEQQFRVAEFGEQKSGESCELFRALDVAAEASALLYDGSYFLGWLGVFRVGEGMFTENDLAKLNGLVDSATEKLIEAEHLEVELLDDKPAWVLVNPKLLEVECATGSAFTWLTDERKEELLDQLAGLEVADSFPIKLVIDGYAVWVNHMSGELGMRLLATVEHSPMPEKRPDAVLTPRQREVVGYAAAGATNREIAETLDITPDTVSDHLSEAYNRLGVANRVELALTLTQTE